MWLQCLVPRKESERTLRRAQTHSQGGDQSSSYGIPRRDRGRLGMVRKYKVCVTFSQKRKSKRQSNGKCMSYQESKQQNRSVQVTHVLILFFFYSSYGQVIIDTFLSSLHTHKRTNAHGNPFSPLPSDAFPCAACRSKPALHAPPSLHISLPPLKGSHHLPRRACSTTAKGCAKLGQLVAAVFVCICVVWVGRLSLCLCV